MKTPIEDKKCTTPRFRASFVSVAKPRVFQGESDGKFACTMLFNPDEVDLSTMEKCAEVAATEKWGPKPKWPKNLRMPFRDGSEKAQLQGYEGTIFVTATSKQRPGLVDKKLQPILDPEEFYSGAYGRATVIAFAYETKGNRGVSFALQNIQKLDDGEAFTGRRKAEDDFEAVEDSSDDQANYESDDDVSEESMGL